jgi:capsule polysaccharide export protein KpsC/LpsZ
MVGLTLWKGCRGDDHTKETSFHTKVLESFQKDQGSNDPSTISQKKEFIIWKPNGKEKVEGVKKVNEVGNLNEVAHVSHNPQEWLEGKCRKHWWFCIWKSLVRF